MRDPRLSPGHPTPADVTLVRDGVELQDVYLSPVDGLTRSGCQEARKNPAELN